MTSQPDATGSERPAVPFAYQMVTRVAARHGIALTLEPFAHEAARLRFPNGRVSFFRHGNLDINGSGTADIARDKHACAHFLAAEGIPVPATLPVARPASDGPVPYARLDQFAATYGWPLVVKPNGLYGGRGVERVYGRAALLQALERVLRLDKLALVQPVIPGDDVRVVVMDETAVAAYRRVPPSLVGDGQRTVKQLLDRYYDGHAVEGQVRPDRHEATGRLARRPGGLRRRPATGESVMLVDAANVATGARVLDLASTAAPDVLALAVAATKAVGLRLAGVDILTGKVDGQTAPSQPVVLEINSAPELDGFANLGDAQATRVEQLYERILLEMAS